MFLSWSSVEVKCCVPFLFVVECVCVCLSIGWYSVLVCSAVWVCKRMSIGLIV